MDHRQIEERNLIAAYAAGTLGPEDVERFEEHLLECADCRRQVEWEEDLRSSFRAATAPAPAAVPLRRAPRWRLPLLAAAALAAVSLPLGWLLIERLRLLADAAQLRAEVARLRTAPSAQDAALPALPALMAELRQAKETQGRLAEELAETTRARGNSPIFTVGVVRGGEPGANRIELGSRPEWIVLSVELPAGTGASYEATLLTVRGEPLVRVSGLHPRADDTISIGLWSASLHPGPYRLRLHGSGRSGPAIEIPLQVSRPAL